MNSKIGAGLLLVAGVLIFVMAGNFTTIGYVLSALAVLGLAAGALISGTADHDGRPV